MQTLATAEPNVKAFYAHLFDRPGILGKVEQVIYFFADDGEIVAYEPEMANFCTVLGRTDIADTQRVMDVIVHGGYAAVATSRMQEVQ
jgi:uncharacterized protein YrrD